MSLNPSYQVSIQTRKMKNSLLSPDDLIPFYQVSIQTANLNTSIFNGLQSLQKIKAPKVSIRRDSTIDPHKIWGCRSVRGSDEWSAMIKATLGMGYSGLEMRWMRG